MRVSKIDQSGNTVWRFRANGELFGGAGTRISRHVRRDPWLDSGDQLGIMRLAGFIFHRQIRLDRALGLQSRAIELRNEFFHCRIFAGNITSLQTVQSYLCGD